MNATQFTERVRRAEGKLFRIAYSVLRNEADCADALQEALLRSWRRIGTLRDERLFDTWLTRILINECYTLMRKSRRVLPVREHERPPEHRELHDAIMALDERLRLPLTLHHTEGYTVEEISRILELPSGTVKGRLVQARAALKRALTSEVDI